MEGEGLVAHWFLVAMHRYSVMKYNVIYLTEIEKWATLYKMNISLNPQDHLYNMYAV